MDFYAPEVHLAIEVVGGIHDGQKEQDAVREQHPERLGVRMLRVRNEDVLGDIARVTAEIAARIEELKRLPPKSADSPSFPSEEGGEGRSDDNAKAGKGLRP